MINLGTKELPINSATKTFAILAKRGAGKTYTGAVLAEEFYKNNVPFVVFDPIDVWWGLRFNSDGKSKGLPIVVFGLENADIKIEKDMGKKIAEAVVKHNISCVISTFGMPKTQQRHLISEFAEELLKINNSPRHIFIEEAHEFVPQRVFGPMGKVFNSVSNLVVMGRNRGLGVTLINQRAATINKDVLTQIDTLLAFRNVSPQDRKALREWVEYHAAKGDFDNFMKSLPSLPTGEGWIWSPEFLGIFEKLKIRERETFHPDREKLGENFEMPELERIDVQEFISEFNKESKETTIENLENEDNKYLKEIDYNAEILKIRNQYESQLMKKDIELRNSNKIIDMIKSAIGQYSSNSEVVNVVNSSNVDMWIDKVGRNSGAGRILKFLSERSGMGFTKAQVALATKMSSRGGSYNTYLSTLRRNNLIKEEGGLLYVNPDL